MSNVRSLMNGVERRLDKLERDRGTASAEQSARFSRAMYELHRRISEPLGKSVESYEEYRARCIEADRRRERFTPEQERERLKFIIAAIDFNNSRPFQIEPITGVLTWLDDDRPRPVPPPGMEKFAEAFRWR